MKFDVMTGGLPLRSMAAFAQDAERAGFSGIVVTEGGRTAYLGCGAAALAADFLGALPADLDGSAATTRPNLFRPATAQLLGPDGTPAAAEPGLLPIRPARTQRWDLCLD